MGWMIIHLEELISIDLLYKRRLIYELLFHRRWGRGESSDLHMTQS